MAIQQVQAIQTRYRGHFFRSRLEARWAVFFDALGWNWEYEPQGFNLPENGCYLPDFYVEPLSRHEWSTGPFWAEIKGKDPSRSELRKLRELSRVTGLCATFLSLEQLKYDHREIEDICTGDWHFCAGYAIPWLQLGISIFPIDYSSDSSYDEDLDTPPDCPRLIAKSHEWVRVADRSSRLSMKLFEQAQHAALGARFEHGQNGPT